MHPVSSVVKTPFRLLRLLRLCYASCYALNHQNPTVLPSLLRLLRLLRLQTAPPGGRKILSPSLRCVWSSWALWPLITGRAVLLSGNPDLSGPTAPQDSGSVRNAETESGVILTHPDPSGPIRTVPCSTEISGPSQVRSSEAKKNVGASTPSDHFS